jgi:hypothetical protein
MAKIEISFTRDLTLGAIDGIARYYELVEMQLQDAKRAERQQIYETIKGLYVYGVHPGDSQVAISPLCRPSLSANCRWSDDPWVHDSGET